MAQLTSSHIAPMANFIGTKKKSSGCLQTYDKWENLCMLFKFGPILVYSLRGEKAFVECGVVDPPLLPHQATGRGSLSEGAATLINCHHKCINSCTHPLLVFKYEIRWGGGWAV